VAPATRRPRRRACEYEEEEEERDDGYEEEEPYEEEDDEDQRAPTRERLLGEAAAANDVSKIGRLISTLDVNKLNISMADQPEALVRRMESCVLLDVAVGCGAVDVTKYVLEFHDARPTRETMSMAIANGTSELVRLMWMRLPAPDEANRRDFLVVAAEFQQLEIFAWLFRDATQPLTREILRKVVTMGSVDLIEAVIARMPAGELCSREDLLEVAAEWHRGGALSSLIQEATELEDARR
jgi:hypothetical protein